eukprot:3766618-Amphidinium_carterae.1
MPARKGESKAERALRLLNLAEQVKVQAKRVEIIAALKEDAELVCQVYDMFEDKGWFRRYRANTAAAQAKGKSVTVEDKKCSSPISSSQGESSSKGAASTEGSPTKADSDAPSVEKKADPEKIVVEGGKDQSQLHCQ